MSIVLAIILLIIANGAPVLANDILKSRLAWPVDAGRNFIDARPWLGSSKTWRGLLSAVISTSIVAQLSGIGWQLGAVFGLLAMAGDLCSSFVKRRMNIPVSGRALLLDQVPESLLPMLVLWKQLGLASLMEALLVVVIFVLLDMMLSPLLYKLKIRQRPY